MNFLDKKSARSESVDTFPFSVSESGGISIAREAFLGMCRDYLARLREGLFKMTPTGEYGGVKFVRANSKIVDAVVGMVYFRTLEEHGLSPENPDMAVLAMGGYGRAELAPQSDVDILILCKRKTQVVKQAATTFVQLMWDVGFELGHSVESIVESESALAQHPDTKTALIESRWVCGSQRIARTVKGQISRIRRKDREIFLNRKIKDALTRYEKYGYSYQLVEPNIKMSPGGLRDYQSLGWFGMVASRGDGLKALRKKGLLLSGEERLLERAYNFLLKVRVELHNAAGARQDHLTVRMQRVVSRRLGYGKKGGHLGVELFMKDYYTHTQTIFRITEDIIEDLRFGSGADSLLGRKKVARDGKKLTVRINRSRLEKNPLYAFERQKEAGLKLDRAIKNRLAALLETDLSGPAETRRMRRLFYNFLTCLKRYDLYHHYTADEHSFKVVRNLEVLAAPPAGRPDLLTRLYSEIPDKQVLFLAALLHDIGKIKGRGHAKKGALLARIILKRLSIKDEQIDTICFLIEHHLLMSHFSQRRDPADIDTLQVFCRKIRSRTSLKYLCLLTYADLKATSPLVWTEWKRDLLWALYLKAYEFMARREKHPDKFYKSRKRRILNAFPAGTARDSALRHLDLLPGRYLLTMQPANVKIHLKLLGQLAGQKAVVTAKRKKYFTEITFCTKDEPYRLSQLCGVLTVNDLNILDAYAFTRKDGSVIDIFHVEDLLAGASIDEERLAGIRRDLVSVLAEQKDLLARVEEHVRKWKRRRDASIPVPLKVEFENDLSADFTIIDIFAPDAPGLLFKITWALSSEGLVISRARISTEANRAIDSFDVQEHDGRKVTRAARLRKIRTRLEREIL